MSGIFTPMLAATVNQTDRIQGMALYMNTDGAQVDWFSLIMIFSGMVFITLLLKIFAQRKARKKKEAFEALRAKRKNQDTLSLSEKARLRRTRLNPTRQ